jgi:RNA polymerase sigma-70 factor (ECF subfamily)
MVWPGNTRKIEELVQTHYRSLFAFAYRLSGSVQEAEDLTQDTFCQAQAKLGQLRDWAKARSWLFTILRNGYLHRVRARKIENRVPLEEVGELPERLPAPLPEVDPEKLQLALNELAEEFRTPLILFYFEEFSYREIAEQMEVPLGTIMSRLARAKAYLRSRLLQPGDLALAQDRREGG